MVHFSKYDKHFSDAAFGSSSLISKHTSYTSRQIRLIKVKSANHWSSMRVDRSIGLFRLKKLLKEAVDRVGLPYDRSVDVEETIARVRRTIKMVVLTIMLN